MNHAPAVNLLYLVHRVPWPLDKGDRIRSFHVADYLASRSRLHLACLDDEGIDLSECPLVPRCERLAVEPLGRRRWLSALTALARGRSVSEGAFASSCLAARIDAWNRERRFDAILLSSSALMPYLDAPSLRAARLVVDLVDVDSAKWADYAASSGPPWSWLYARESRLIGELERQALTMAHAVTVISHAEAAELCRASTSGRIEVVRNGVDLEYFHPSEGGTEETRRSPPTCVFVGAMDYWPNVDGATWFCHAVWPELRRRWPSATLRLVGRRPTSAVRRLAQVDGVVVVGSVPDVRPELARATACIMPLRMARGVQNKVLEAMAAAKAIILSPPALVGIDAEPGRHLLLARSPVEWLEHLQTVFADPLLRHELGRHARTFVESTHRWETCLTPLNRLLELGDEPNPREKIAPTVKEIAS